MTRHLLGLGILLLVTTAPALGQSKNEQIRLFIQEQIRLPGKGMLFPPLMIGARAGGLNALQLASKGTFWRDPQWISSLKLSNEQRQKMDEIFQQYRLKLIDITAALQKDELILAPLIEELPGGDEARITAQIDRIAEDRAELEKANSRMLVGIFQILTPDQWTRLRTNKK